MLFNSDTKEPCNMCCLTFLFPEGKKKGGFANTLRRRFGKNKNKQRSQSADRAGTLGRGEVMLNVPGEPGYAPKTTG